MKERHAQSSHFQAWLPWLVLGNALLFAVVALLPRPVPRLAWLAPALANGALATWALLRRSPEEQDAAPADEWPVPLFALDERGRISNCNAAARELLGLGDAAGATLASVTHPDEAPQNATLLAAMRAGNARDACLERRCFGMGGAMSQVRWHLRFHSAAVGAPQVAAVLAEDVSQVRALESRCQRLGESLHDLHSIIAGQNFEQQIVALLDLGRRRFAVETAFVSQVREERLFLLEVRSQDPRLRRSTSYPMGEARAEKLLRPPGPRGLAHASFAGDEPDAREPVFVHEGETYLGAPIVAEGSVWGGLHFSDAEGRPAIDREDRELLGMMASWLGSEIERRQARSQLEHQQKELLQAAILLENLAVRDGLTGAKNRRAFDEHLQTEWLRARRYKTPLSLVLLDVDKFKSFNDTFGHPAGDEVLKKVAQVLGDSIRNIDFLARYGGEEFVLLLPNTDAPGALIVAERLREQIESARWTLRAVTASFGVSTLAPGMEAPSALLQTADEALYRSKEGGRNRVTHALPDVNVASLP